MRCLFIIRSLTGGGAERVVTVLARAMVEKGYEVSIIVYAQTENDYRLDERINVFTMPQRTDSVITKIRRIFDMRKLVREVNPDVIIPFVGTIVYVSWLAVWGLDIPYILTIRNNPWRIPEKKILRLYRDYIAKKAKVIMLQNKEQEEYFKMELRKKCYVVPNPVDEIFIKESKEIYSDEIRNIVAVGRLHKQKNYLLLIKAIAEIVKTYPGIKLSIYGEGKEEKAISSMIYELGLEKNIVLCGRMKKIVDFLKEADLFVMSSDYEGMPNALMEAMALGIPCISSNCKTGPRDLIEHEVNGVLFEVGNISDLVSKIKWAIENPKKLNKVGIKAREDILRSYKSIDVINNMENLLECIKEDN